jgi:hypothetical protein
MPPIFRSSVRPQQRARADVAQALFTGSFSNESKSDERVKEKKCSDFLKMIKEGFLASTDLQHGIPRT